MLKSLATVAVLWANTQESVRVTEFPSISMVRNWIDYLALIFTGILVGIGFFGVRAANKTLKAIERQAEEMKEQTAAALANANAAELNAEAFVKSERAWIMEKLNFPDVIPKRTALTRGSVLSVAFSFDNVGKQPGLI